MKTVPSIVADLLVVTMERLKKVKIAVQLMTTAYLRTLESSMVGTWKHADSVHLSAFHKIH